jgi:hypothetical protein
VTVINGDVIPWYVIQTLLAITIALAGSHCLIRPNGPHGRVRNAGGQENPGWSISSGQRVRHSAFANSDSDSGPPGT